MAMGGDKASHTAEQDVDRTPGGLHFNKIEWVLKEDPVGPTKKPASDYRVWIGCSRYAETEYDRCIAADPCTRSQESSSYTSPG